MKRAYDVFMILGLISTFLSSQTKRFSAAFAAIYNSGNMKVLNGNIIHRTSVQIGGQQQLLTSSKDRKDGVSDFQGLQLNQDVAFLGKRLRINYDAIATQLGQEANLLYDKALPASLRNAKFVVREGSIVIFETNISAIVAAEPTNAAGVAHDYFDLEHPVTLMGGKDIKYEILFPETAAAVAASTEYVEVDWQGDFVTSATAA